MAGSKVDAQRFVILLKTYTAINASKLFELVSAQFRLSQNDHEDLSNLFLEDVMISERNLSTYAKALKVPIALKGQELEQAKKWLTDYSLRIWLSLERGSLKLPEEEAMLNSEEQCRFLIELERHLSWVEIARAFAREYDTELTRNMATILYQNNKLRTQMPTWATYARQSANGILRNEDAKKANYWLQKYVKKPRQLDFEYEGIENERDYIRFNKCLFVEELKVYLPWRELADIYCSEFEIEKNSKTWQSLAKKFMKRKQDNDWIFYSRHRSSHDLTAEQKFRVKLWLDQHVTTKMREKALLEQKNDRAEWETRERKVSASSSFLATQMEAASLQSGRGVNKTSKPPRPENAGLRQSPSPYSRSRPRNFGTLNGVPEDEPEIRSKDSSKLWSNVSSAYPQTSTYTARSTADNKSRIAPARRGASVNKPINLDDDEMDYENLDIYSLN